MNMNTPDTEMVKEWYASLPERPQSHTPMSVSAEEVADLLSSRDTYWKERVRGEKIQNEAVLHDIYEHVNELLNAYGHRTSVRFVLEQIISKLPTPITNEDNLK